MNKKWLMLGSAVGISGVVMVTTGLAAMASTSGYDAYKSALKNTKTAKSVSVQAQASLQDNGNVLASANGSVKASLESKTGSGTFDLSSGGVGQKVDVYKQDNSTILKSSASDTYYVQQQNERGKSKKPETENNAFMNQQLETVIDALIGNLKDQVTVDTKSDGSKQVSVQLANAQIPAVVNAIAPIAIKQALTDNKEGNANEKQDPNEFPFGRDLLENQPQLSKDIQLDKISVKASISPDNYIVHQEADVTVSGKDDAGTAHVVTIHLNADLSNYNNTSPDKIDLTGKTVQTMQHGQEGNHKD